MKNCYIYGAHVKTGYYKPYKSFKDLYQDGLPRKKKGIEFLVKSGKYIQPYLGDIYDDIGFNRELSQSCEIHFGYPRMGLETRASDPNNIQQILTQSYDRVVLMNDEVLWQWKTGSVLYYRFENDSETLSFFKYIFDGLIDVSKYIRKSKTNNPYQVGDYIQFTKDFYAESELSPGFTYKTGMICRVYHSEKDWIMVSPIDGVTAIRMPGTGGSKMLLGFSKIPLDVITKSTATQWICQTKLTNCN